MFTGGVGEHAGEIRMQAALGLAFLGVGLDEQRNGEISEDCEIGVEGAAARTVVVTAREDLEIAQQVRVLLARLTRK